MWFRIELNKDRSVKSCEEVEGSTKDGRGVYYIEATTKAGAIQALAERWKRRHEGRSSYLKNRRAERYAQGVCSDCDNRRKPTSSLCDDCTRRQSERQREMRHGAEPTRAPRAVTQEEKAAALAREIKARRDQARKDPGKSITYRLLAFQSCLDALNSMTATAYREWLTEKVTEYQTRAQQSREKRAKRWATAAE